MLFMNGCFADKAHTSSSIKSKYTVERRVQQTRISDFTLPRQKNDRTSPTNTAIYTAGVGVDFSAPHPTQTRSFWRQSSQPIVWLILKKQSRKIHKLNATRKIKQCKIQHNKNGSVISYDTQPGNEVSLFYNAPSPYGVQYTPVSTKYLIITQCQLKEELMS